MIPKVKSMSYASDFETQTGVNFAVFNEKAKVVWLIDLAEPGRSPGLSVHNRPDEVCAEIDNGWPGYTIVHRNWDGTWDELVKKGGKLDGKAVEFVKMRPWDGMVPTDKEVAEWFEARAADEQTMLLSAEEAAILLSCALRLVNDISAGRHSGERGTTELSANVLSPVSKILADLNWQDVAAMKNARKRIKELCDSEPDLMRCYQALWAFGKGA